MHFSCVYVVFFFFFFKQKTAYEMRISDWSSDVCSSDLAGAGGDVVVGSVFKLAHRPHLSLAIAPDDSLPPALVRPTSACAGDEFFEKAAPQFNFFSCQK